MAATNNWKQIKRIYEGVLLDGMSLEQWWDPDRTSCITAVRFVKGPMKSKSFIRLEP